MVLATKADINKRKKKLETFLKGLNDDGSMSEKKMCTQIRSAIRGVWMKHPVKLAYLFSHTYPDKNPATRTKWLGDCALCKGSFKQGDLQIDHIKGEHSLLTLDDVVPFANSILGVTQKDLRLLCIPCHEVVTYAERYHMSIEEATAEKAVIAKLKQTVAKQKAELKKAGYKPVDISNADKRRVCYRELLK